MIFQITCISFTITLICFSLYPCFFVIVVFNVFTFWCIIFFSSSNFSLVSVIAFQCVVHIHVRVLWLSSAAITTVITFVCVYANCQKQKKPKEEKNWLCTCVPLAQCNTSISECRRDVLQQLLPYTIFDLTHGRVLVCVCIGLDLHAVFIEFSLDGGRCAGYKRIDRANCNFDLFVFLAVKPYQF